MALSKHLEFSKPCKINSKSVETLKAHKSLVTHKNHINNIYVTSQLEISFIWNKHGNNVKQSISKFTQPYSFS